MDTGPGKAVDSAGVPETGAGKAAAATAPDKGPQEPPSGRLRYLFGLVFFAVWLVMAVLWVWTNIRLVAAGDAGPLITALLAVALLFLLGSMEGLEVAVIDRADLLWPGRPKSWLASWLAARQLFVALIVTSATLLANRSVLYVPITGTEITNGVATGAFDTVFTGLSVLWFAQIMPKMLGAMNPDRYIHRLRPVMFPVVRAVHRSGISQPGEWTAGVLERRLNWPASPAQLGQQAASADLTHPAIWRELGKSGTSGSR